MDDGFNNNLVKVQNNLKKFTWFSIFISTIIIFILLETTGGSVEGLIFEILTVVKSIGNIWNIIFMFIIFLLLKTKNVQILKTVSIVSIILSFSKMFLIINHLIVSQNNMLIFWLENSLSIIMIILLLIMPLTLLIELKNIKD